MCFVFLQPQKNKLQYEFSMWHFPEMAEGPHVWMMSSGGFKGWPGVAWPPHLKAHSHLYSSTTGMNCTDLYRPSEIISPTSLL